MPGKENQAIQMKLISEGLDKIKTVLLEYKNDKNAQKAKKLADSITFFQITFDKAKTMNNISGDYFEIFTKGYKTIQNSFKAFAETADPKRDKNILKQLEETVKTMNSRMPALLSVKKSALLFKSLEESKKPGAEFIDIDAQIARVGNEGSMPSVLKCHSTNANEGNMIDFFDSFLWLHSYSSRKSADQIRENDYFEETYERLRNELLTADHDRQTAFGVMLVRQETALKRKLSAKLQALKTEAEKKGNSLDSVYTALASDPLYSATKRIGELKKSFERTIIGNAADSAVSIIGTYAAVNTPQMQEINVLLNGEMENALQKTGSAAMHAETVKSQNEAFFNGINNGNTKVINSLAKAFEKLITDGRSASLSFDAVRKAAIDLAAVDFSKPMSFEESMKIFSKARDAAKLYLDTHRKEPHSDKGKERVQNTRALISAIDEQIAAVRTRQNMSDNAEITELEKNKTPDNLRKIAKLQRHIAPVRMIPKASEFTLEPTKWQRFKSAAKHYVYSAVFTILGNSIGQLINGVTYPFNKGKKKPKVETTLDHEFIPGRNGERFKPIVLNDDPDQLIIGDTRRTPLIWEKPVPEDPNQPPTVSFEFNQGREGDATANAWVKDAKGNWDFSTGHGLITLHYSRKNPFSGKLERYKLRMGFHPRGGFGTTYIDADMALSGTTVPGQLMDNTNYIFTTGKTVTVNNAQINKILLASLEYEKGGYNTISRNCTTFVKDMADAAGIPVNDILKEVDFETESKGEKAGLVAMSVAGGPLVSRLANRDILSKSEKTDLSYQRFGQKMLNKEDVQRLDKKAYNLRMKGYSPSHAGEAIRHSSDFKFHANNYRGRIQTANTAPYSRELNMIDSLEEEIGVLRAAIIKDAVENGFSEADIMTQLDALDKYGNTVLDAIRENEGKAFDAATTFEEGVEVGVETSKEDQTKSLIDGKAMLSEFEDGYTEIFKNTFKSNPKLSIPFSHITSILTNIKEAYDDQYANLRFDTMRFDAIEKIRPEKDKVMDSMIDPEREIGFAIKYFENAEYEFYNIEKKEMHYKCKAPEAVGMIMAQGSLKKGIEVRQAKKALHKDRGIFDKLTEEEEKMDKAFDRQINLSNDFASSLKSFFSGRELTENDYRLAFVEIPKGLEGYTNIDPNSNAKIIHKNVYTPDKCFQAACYEQLLRGSKIELRNIIQNEIIEDVDRFTERMAKLISDKMEQRPEELDKLKNVLSEKAKSEEPFDEKRETEQNYNLRMNQKVNKMIAESLIQTFMNPLLTEIAEKNSGLNMTEKLMDNTVLFTKGIDSNKLLESVIFRNAVNKGVELPEFENPQEEKIIQEEKTNQEEKTIQEEGMIKA